MPAGSTTIDDHRRPQRTTRTTQAPQRGFSCKTLSLFSLPSLVVTRSSGVNAYILVYVISKSRVEDAAYAGTIDSTCRAIKFRWNANSILWARTWSCRCSSTIIGSSRWCLARLRRRRASRRSYGRRAAPRKGRTSRSPRSGCCSCCAGIPRSTPRRCAFV